MKIEKIQHDYKLKNSLGSKKSSPAFAKGKVKLSDRVKDALPNKNALKKMESLEWLKGESGGILITAIGTGAVAPFPIAYNPFVKPKKGATEEEIEDLKNTKKYTAFRQPLSAGLSILFQLGALKPIDIILDKIFNEEKYAKFFKLSTHVDQTVLNKKSYIERLVEKDMSKEGKKAPSVFSILTDGWSKYKKRDKEFDAQFKEKVEKIRDEQLQKVADNFQKTGKIEINGRSLDNKTLAELINKQIDEYIADATKLKIDTDSLAFYTDRGETLCKNETYLKKILGGDVVKNKNPKELETHLKSLIEKEQDGKIKKILEEILERPEDIRQSHISRTFQRIKTIQEILDNQRFTYDDYFNVLGKRNTALDKTITNLKKIKIENCNEATRETVMETMEKIIKHCQFDGSSDNLLKSVMHDTVTFDSDKEKLTSKIYKDTAKQYRKLVENTYKGRNQVIKILVGVFITLPITCNVLNWVYPRFMDKFFPELAGSKRALKQRGAKHG